MNATPDAITNAWMVTISLLGLWVLLVFFVRDYLTDLFRQRLFTLRDDLFDMALAGEVGFDHPAYGLLRNAINGFIRFGHRMSFAAGIIWAWASRNDNLTATLGDQAFAVRYEKAQVGLDARVLAKMNAKLKRVHFCIFWYIVLTSPVLSFLILAVSAILLPIIIPFALGALVQHRSRVYLNKAYGALRTPFDALDSAALQIGNAA